jgi:hypothetical protein
VRSPAVPWADPRINISSTDRASRPVSGRQARGRLGSGQPPNRHYLAFDVTRRHTLDGTFNPIVPGSSPGRLTSSNPALCGASASLEPVAEVTAEAGFGPKVHEQYTDSTRRGWSPPLAGGYRRPTAQGPGGDYPAHMHAGGSRGQPCEVATVLVHFLNPRLVGEALEARGGGCQHKDCCRRRKTLPEGGPSGPDGKCHQHDHRHFASGRDLDPAEHALPGNDRNGGDRPQGSDGTDPDGQR